MLAFDVALMPVGAFERVAGMATFDVAEALLP